eukprot:11067052-Alexandrium_andersonii.AAC.1
MSQRPRAASAPRQTNNAARQRQAKLARRRRRLQQRAGVPLRQVDARHERGGRPWALQQPKPSDTPPDGDRACCRIRRRGRACAPPACRVGRGWRSPHTDASRSE